MLSPSNATFIEALKSNHSDLKHTAKTLQNMLTLSNYTHILMCLRCVCVWERERVCVKHRNCSKCSQAQKWWWEGFHTVMRNRWPLTSMCMRVCSVLANFSHIIIIIIIIIIVMGTLFNLSNRVYFYSVCFCDPPPPQPPQSILSSVFPLAFEWTYMRLFRILNHLSLSL